MRKGFSLTELLVGLGIVLLLTGLGVRWAGSILGLLQASPFRPLAFLWRFPGFPWLAERAYRFVADRRLGPGWKERRLPRRDLRAHPPWAVLLTLAFVGLYAPFSRKGLVEAYRSIPPTVSQTLGSLGLDLRWGHSAPRPPARADWVQAKGVAVTGALVDPWRWLLLKDPAYRKEVPCFPVLLLGGEHWRKFWWGAWRMGEADRAWWEGLALHFCAIWNWEHWGRERLHTLTLFHSLAYPGDGKPRLTPMWSEVCP